MRSLIVNADDFGLDEDVSMGIVEAMQQGIVTSTSVMVCTSAGPALLASHRHELRDRAGVHLQLTGGIPRSPRERIPSLAAVSGWFPANRRELGELRIEEIETEWRAQIETFLASGLEPVHIDSHHHVHKHPAAFEAYCRIAAAYGLRARSCDPGMTKALRAAGVRCPDGFECGWTGNTGTADDLLARIDEAFRACGGSGTVEVMCHPGRRGARGRELETLCHPTLPERIRERGIVLGAHLGRP